MRAWVEVPASVKAGTQTILMDVDDYVRLGGRRLSIGSHGYVQLFDDDRVQTLHRWLLNLRPGDGRIGDHRSGDANDYRRNNLRVVDPSGSSQNVAGRGYSQFRGVYPTRSGRWAARVKFRGKTYRLGTFTSELDAARVADAKRRELMPCYVPRPDMVAALYGDIPFDSYPLPTPIRDRLPRGEIVDTYLRLRPQGLSRREIANRLGVTKMALSLALRRAALAGDSRTDYDLRTAQAAA